ncbi:superoxide dismutase family protein [Nocardia sp. CDC159]|uniref:Superoxide dismutase family protein n=1 Tax=Nocardia pulmonis TaxID=2951408 RepID=A0A9X2EG81_9NOCA|nr:MULTISPECIES: superoxide dismutase family protein [Nocardia]MCM6778965.1 superoxide dismutase family protein [Nocardia pulmonis]MCM6791854.1 superoxide dismutase family protein [Nocardia sp. CDC159]
MPPTSGEGPAEPGHEPGGNSVTAGFIDAQGRPAGTVTFVERAGFVQIRAEVHNLEPGRYGIAVHEHGVCEPDAAFRTAGALLATPGDNSASLGDLGSIEIRADNRGLLTTTTGAFTLADLRTAATGRAVIIHSGKDDPATTGDRIACAAVR